MDGEKIVIGSGKLYINEFTGTIPEDAALEVNTNLLGYIQGGATLEYKPKFVEVSDDLGLKTKVILTEEEVTLKSGVLTWNGATLKKISSTARVTEANGKRTVKIGGVSMQDGKQYILRFLHEDPVDGDIRISIVGNNQAGFSLAFIKDKETVIDAEFKAQPLDSEGTKIIYEEEVPLEALTVTSAEGTITGDTKLTILPILTVGNSYMYKTAASVELPETFDICDVEAGYTAWNGTEDITATTGNEIVIVEVNSDFEAVKAGKATVVSKA